MRKLLALIATVFIIGSCGVFNKSGNNIKDGLIIPTKEELVNAKWLWKETILADKTKIIDTKQKSFISFAEDDKLGVGSDCNKGSAFYKLKKDVIEISPVMSTKMFCGEKSTEKEYFKELKMAHKLFLLNQELHISLKDSIGEMIFVKE
jgi:heat shock protein HslJ